jgi:hypothetical protein
MCHLQNTSSLAYVHFPVKHLETAFDMCATRVYKVYHTPSILPSSTHFSKETATVGVCPVLLPRIKIPDDRRHVRCALFFSPHLKSNIRRYMCICQRLPRLRQRTSYRQTRNGFCCTCCLGGIESNFNRCILFFSLNTLFLRDLHKDRPVVYVLSWFQVSAACPVCHALCFDILIVRQRTKS